MFKISKQKKKGFSLVELMVAVSIFAIVMLIGTGAILAIVNGNKKNQSMQVAISNLNYAVENMTRNMKTGRGFQNSADFNYPTDNITFTTTDDENVKYFYASNVDSNGDTKGSLMIQYLDEPGAPAIAVTAPEIDIDTLTFAVTGADANDGFQPAVIIYIAGTVSNGSLTTDFALHTSVTQRSVDF